MRRFWMILTLVGVCLIATAMPPASFAAVPAVNGKIVFDSDRDGNAEIYAMNADGSGATRITNHAGADIRPAASPDGTKIAFMSNRDGNFEIYVMNADGSGQTNLTSNPANDADPAWSRTEPRSHSYPAGTGMTRST